MLYIIYYYLHHVLADDDGLAEHAVARDLDADDAGDHLVGGEWKTKIENQIRQNTLNIVYYKIREF